MSDAGNVAVQATANASGVATATFPPFAVAVTRIVSQVAVSTNSVAISTADLLLNNNLITHSPSGNSDSASGDPPVTVRASDSLIVKWSNCTVGSTCTATFYYVAE